MIPDTEFEFGTILSTVLSPSRPIQSVEFLRGRTTQLEEIRRALYSPGRHLFIHGYRGVGKTSLAQTAAFQNQSSDGEPIFLSSADGTFEQIVHDMVVRGLSTDPRRVRDALDASLGVSAYGFSAEIRRSVENSGSVPLPTSMNDALQLAGFLARIHSTAPVVVFDEFDQLKDPKEQTKFANFAKSIADDRINIKLIFCGIGESIDQLFAAHESAPRYFHTVKLDRLPWEARFEILDFAAGELGLSIDESTKYRVAQISDGFPHYIHLLCEKLFWLIFLKSKNGVMYPALFETAMGEALESIEPFLKKPYEVATRKYTDDYEGILWAVADTHQLQRPSSEIFQSYERIMKGLRREPLTRDKFNNRINRLKRTEHSSILSATRSGWYEFTEKMLRGFARLRAMHAGAILEAEHPAEGRRIPQREVVF